jgi:hypothetical protein
MEGSNLEGQNCQNNEVVATEEEGEKKEYLLIRHTRDVSSVLVTETSLTV